MLSLILLLVFTWNVQAMSPILEYRYFVDGKEHVEPVFNPHFHSHPYSESKSVLCCPMSEIRIVDPVDNQMNEEIASSSSEKSKLKVADLSSGRIRRRRKQRAFMDTIPEEDDDDIHMCGGDSVSSFIDNSESSIGSEMFFKFTHPREIPSSFPERFKPTKTYLLFSTPSEVECAKLLNMAYFAIRHNDIGIAAYAYMKIRERIEENKAATKMATSLCVCDHVARFVSNRKNYNTCSYEETSIRNLGSAVLACGTIHLINVRQKNNYRLSKSKLELSRYLVSTLGIDEFSFLRLQRIFNPDQFNCWLNRQRTNLNNRMKVGDAILVDSKASKAIKMSPEVEEKVSPVTLLDRTPLSPVTRRIKVKQS